MPLSKRDIYLLICERCREIEDKLIGLEEKLSKIDFLLINATIAKSPTVTREIVELLEKTGYLDEYMRCKELQ